MLTLMGALPSCRQEGFDVARAGGPRFARPPRESQSQHPQLPDANSLPQQRRSNAAAHSHPRPRAVTRGEPMTRDLGDGCEPDAG